MHINERVIFMQQFMKQVPDREIIDTLISNSNPQPLALESEDETVKIDFKSDKQTAIVKAADINDVKIAWTNAVPLFGSIDYRFVVVIHRAKTYYRFVHGDSLSLMLSEDKLLFATSIQGDIFDAENSMIDIAGKHFYSTYYTAAKNSPLVFAKNIVQFFEQEIKLTFASKFQLEVIRKEE